MLYAVSVDPAKLNSFQMTTDVTDAVSRRMRKSTVGRRRYAFGRQTGAERPPLMRSHCCKLRSNFAISPCALIQDGSEVKLGDVATVELGEL